MRRICLFLIVLGFILKEASSAAVFDSNKCDQGCKTANDCPTNAHCVAVTQSSDCGLCLCQAGYRTEGSNCVPNDPSKSGKQSSQQGNNGNNGNNGNGGGGGGGGTGDQPTSTNAPADTPSTSGAPTTTTSPGTTTQGAPPGPVPLSCSDYACSPQIQSNDADNPFTVRAQLFNESTNCKRKLNVPGRPCKMNGGGTCYGVYCLTVDPSNDYCICDLYRVDRQCAVDKPGKCESATGAVPPNAYKAQNKRYRNKNSPDNGSIYARHFASNMDDCVKLCQWAGGACHSVNYGQIAGQPVCELLSVTVTKGSLLEAWVVNAPGWQHEQVI